MQLAAHELYDLHELTMSCNHAYEVWQWMAKKGFYPIKPASQNAQDTMASIYKRFVNLH